MATDAGHCALGVVLIRRFQRPILYQQEVWQRDVLPYPCFQTRSSHSLVIMPEALPTCRPMSAPGLDTALRRHTIKRSEKGTSYAKGGEAAAMMDAYPTMNREGFTKRAILGCCFLVLALVTLIGVFKTPLWGDELEYHFPLVLSISWKTILDPHSTYSSAYAPLPFFMASLVHRALPSLYAVRFLNWLVALSCALVFRRMLSKESPSRDAILLLFLSNPYFLRGSCTFHVTNYGLFFGLSALFIYFYSNSRYRHAAAYLLMTMATLSMQWMLMLFIGISLYELRLCRTGDLSRRQFVGLAALKLLASLPAFGLIWVWGGLTHPNFKQYALHPSFESANVVLAGLGFLFFFYSIFNILRLGWSEFVLIIVLAPLLFIAQPVFAWKQGIGLFTGFESNLLRLVEAFTSVPYSILLFGLALSGMVFCALAMKTARTGVAQTGSYIALGLGSAYVGSVMLSSGHVYVMVPFLLLMLEGELSQRRGLLPCMNVQWYSAGVGYLLYYMLIKSHGAQL